MASNRELIDQAESLGRKLNVQVKTEGLSNAALVELVSDLQAKETGGHPRGEPAPVATSSDPRAPVGTGTRSTQYVIQDGTPPPHGGIRAGASTDVLRAQKDEQGKVGPKPSPFTVAKGKSITSSRGILGAGEQVRPEDVSGQENLDRLVAKGVVAKT